MNQKKTVLITGASRGIGMSAATAFARTKDYNLVLNCSKSKDELEALSNLLHRSFGVEVLPVVADVSKPAEVKKLFQKAVKTFGQVDVLINNAGISMVGLMTDLSDEDWNRMLQTNLSSVFYCSREAVPSMVNAKEGAIINVSSVWGNQGASCEVAYSATKGGVNAFTRALAKELAPSNIRVNAVAFGCIDTEMNGHLSEEEKKALGEEIPVGRFANAEEAGEFLRRIAEMDSYFTGQVVSYDGGWC